ncbi:hypothetical protein D3C74_310870 [compost metagenome]
MRAVLVHDRSLAPNLRHDANLQLLQITQSAMHQLRRTARRPGSKVLHLHKSNPHPPCRRVQGDSGPGDPAAHDQQIQRLSRVRHLLQQVSPILTRKRIDCSHVHPPSISACKKRPRPHFSRFCLRLSCFRNLSWQSVYLSSSNPCSICASDGLSVSFRVAFSSFPSR